MNLLRAQDLRAQCDFTYWTTAREANPQFPKATRSTTQRVFCQTDHIFEFFRWARTKLCRFVVISHESDHTLTPAHFSSRSWNVTKWFGANCAVRQPDCCPLPLGLANDSSHLTLKREHFDKEFPPFHDRKRLLYVNHREETNPDVRGGLKAHFRSLPWAEVENAPESGGLDSFLNSLASSRFVLCPPGNGIDTHRMWETLAAGAVPVVLRNPVTEHFAAHARMLVVENFRDVSRELLESYAQGLEGTLRPPAVLDSGYWMREINEAMETSSSLPLHRLMVAWFLRKARGR